MTHTRLYIHSPTGKLWGSTSMEKLTDFKVIVCGAILNKDNKILIARRKPQKKMGGLWEFPGGKLKWGEELTEALRREISEELGIKITVETLLHIKPYVYDHGAVLILFYLCRYASGEITLKDHDRYEWCAADELKKHPLLPANDEVLGMLKKK